MLQQHENSILTYRARLDAAAISLVDDLRAERRRPRRSGSPRSPGERDWTLSLREGCSHRGFSPRSDLAEGSG